MSKYSDKKKARVAATLAAIDAVEGSEKPMEAKPQERRRCEPVSLGKMPFEFALSVEACLAMARTMERTAKDLEAATAKGLQRGEATSMAGMAKSLCARIGELSDRARRYASAWAEPQNGATS